MGLTKQYLRYVPAGNFNLINSANCNVVFVTLEGQEGRFVAAGACEHVYIWDLRLGEKAQVLPGENSDTTRLANSPNQRHLAVGYADGKIKTFDLRSGENVSIFEGHRKAITTLAYDALGHRLASGSADTDIIVWDVIAERGLCRLAGHKGLITNVAFMQEHNILISSSKDTFIKFWDIDTEHNFKTLVGHRSEVWDFSLVKNDSYLITGCNSTELWAWKIFFADKNNTDITNALKTLDINENDNINDPNYPLRCEKIGVILRAGKGRVISMETDVSRNIIACHGDQNIVELFHMIPTDEVNEKMAKRLKKAMKKAAKENQEHGETVVDPTILLNDHVRRLAVVTVDNKVKTVDLVMGKGGELRVAVGINNNSLELHSLSINNKTQEPVCLRKIAAQGHRTKVQAICFSSDNLAIATASGDSIKLWNRPSLTCLRTIECGHALTAIFVPGDRHLIVGMLDGKMLIVDMASGEILEEVAAHTAKLRSLSLFPDMKGFASGSYDKTVKFWNFDLIEDPNGEIKCKILSVLHTKTLNLEENVLCIKISQNSRFIAVSLLDSTVKIFFFDTFKFFVSLYGHKMPVVSMDISGDSTLIATGSSDKNIKIWGLDFGDCHKSLFAHDGEVSGLCFVPRTHYLFTCGKDGKVKEWDCDNFQKIITLQGHSGESLDCAISPNGMFIASCGTDNAIRLYERSSEPLVLEDEAEEEREKKENELATGETSAVQGQKQHLLPSRKTVNTEKAAELILECLEISKAYKEECDQVVPPNPSPAIPPLMQAYNVKTIDDYLLETLKRVRAGDMEEALLLLPYSTACELLHYLPKLLESNYQAEMLARLAVSLIRAHHGPMTANATLLPILEQVRDLSMKRISELKDTIGYNLHGMGFLQRNIEKTEGIELFKDATKQKKRKIKNRRTKEGALKRAMLTL